MFGATLTCLHVMDYHNFWNLTQKNGSLKAISIPLNSCFSHRNVLQNGDYALSEMLFKKFFFFDKSSIFVHFGPYDLVQITLACSRNTYQIMYGETLDFQGLHLQR